MGWWRRNWSVLAVLLAIVLVIDVAYSVLSTCDPVGEQARQATGGQQAPKQCTPFSGPLFAFIHPGLVWTGHIFERPGEAVIAVFTVVLAFSTILLWRATERLYEAGEAQREHSEGVASQQADHMRQSIGAAVRSAQAAERTADTTRDTAEKHLRAYVLVDNASLKIDGIVEYEVTAKNFGQTPAHDVTFFSGTRHRPYPPPAPLPPAIGLKPLSKRYLGANTVIVSDDKLAREFTVDEKVALLSGADVFYVVGEIEYKDIFGSPHKTTFKFACGGPYGPPSPDGTLMPCEDGNEAD